MCHTREISHVLARYTRPSWPWTSYLLPLLASDFIVNNHKGLMLPLTFLMLHTVPWFMPRSVGICPSEMSWKYTSYIKQCPHWILHHFMCHLGLGIELTHENLQNDLGVPCFSAFPLFPFFSSSLYSTARPWNLLQSGAVSSWSCQVFYSPKHFSTFCPWRISALVQLHQPSLMLPTMRVGSIVKQMHGV